jgi:hypothetical protein
VIQYGESQGPSLVLGFLLEESVEASTSLFKVVGSRRQAEPPVDRGGARRDYIELESWRQAKSDPLLDAFAVPEIAKVKKQRHKASASKALGKVESLWDYTSKSGTSDNGWRLLARCEIVWQEQPAAATASLADEGYVSAYLQPPEANDPLRSGRCARISEA